MAMMICTVASFAEQNYATKVFDAPCSEVKPVAITFFQHNGLILNPEVSCENCLIGTTGHLEDARGHVLSTHAAIKRYMDTSKDGKDIFGAWHIHTDLETTAKLTLQPTHDNVCTAKLLFFYSWYATEFLVAVPVDGDKASRPSNLRLETEYLQAIAAQLPLSRHH
ncbi:MAG TPA: hypothetical protein VNY78_00540 [Edaphobacter sp.]|nr:hypothetical protein [Edaphobacter sp.]